VTPEQAYAECSRITAVEAKNFSYGIRLLPPPKRDAMSALYAYARRIDDIADGDRVVGDIGAALAEVDEQIAAMARGELPDPDDAVLVGVHDAARRFDVPVLAFGEVVEGCRRDATGVRYATFADTEAYCRLVAGAVGRLSLGVFGSTDPRHAPALADDLGVALQLTNILRDVLEDRGRDRTYLPAEDIARFGCRPDLDGPPSALADLVDSYVTLAEGFYARGRRLLPLLDHRSRACVATMANIYHRLLERIARDPGAVFRERVSLTAPQRCRSPCSASRGGPRERVVGERDPGAARGRRRRRARRAQRGHRPRRPRRTGDPAGAGPAPRRGDVVVHPRGAHDRQRPARVHALLHRVPAVPGTHRLGR
jgi:phytoene synthase